MRYEPKERWQKKYLIMGRKAQTIELSTELGINYIPCCMGEAEQLPQDKFCKVCNLPTDGEKCYSKRCPV